MRNTRKVLAIEAICAARALDLLPPLRTSPALEELRARIRAACPAAAGDEPPAPRIDAVDALIASGALRTQEV